ncbi:hypothetical protein K505DRAFT_351833 [Melanomma pulvis-pyrius CBS 109.77]|uniref:Uncharacterized protein n=1 Tax=Melanomma pulvis-pyrius CBS 109.77 TaxID=1314802 RepID=A0A6A6X2R8_9PLEO|nr:hypothetical protein K505DRAFT_351833 [Melanomma pulvis-pyrius CBS 109.77]
MESSISNEMNQSETAIKIGDKHYDVEVSQVPYLASFASFEAKAHPDATHLVHGPIPLIDVALKGIELGYRHCFRSMPAELSQHHILSETYDFLGVDVLDGQSLDDIFTELKRCKIDLEPEYDYYFFIKGGKSKARDAAYKLLYLLFLGDFENETKDAAKMFNAVLFVVSHSATFKWRARVVIRAAYEERFVVSDKQSARLDHWVKEEERGNAGAAYESSTTEVESDDELYDDYYNSDWS